MPQKCLNIKATTELPKNIGYYNNIYEILKMEREDLKH